MRKLRAQTLNRTLCCVIVLLGFSVTQAAKAQNFNHIAIFVELADTKFGVPMAQTASVFNGMNSLSVERYFYEASAGKVSFITHFPMVENEIYVVKLPYSWDTVWGFNADSNRYYFDWPRMIRDAALAVQDKLPADVNFDVNGDGIIDYISFFLAVSVPDTWGEYGAWPSYGVGNINWFIEMPELNGLQFRSVAVNNWTVEYNTGVISRDMAREELGVMIHEILHTFGIGDYYYYDGESYNEIFSALGRWEIMGEGIWFPPSFPSAHVRSRLEWIEIEEITEDGWYTLYRANSGKSTGVAFKIRTNADPTGTQYIVLEYRHKGNPSDFTMQPMLSVDNWGNLQWINEPVNLTQFDGAIYGSGLVIYRVNSDFSGNFFKDETELMVFRPGGRHDTFSMRGLSESYFSANVGRTAFTPNTDPFPFLTDGTRITDIYITNISHAGETISFHFSRTGTVNIPEVEGASLKIYPNPASDFVSIHADFEIAKVAIFNTSGIRVFSEKSVNRISLQDFAEGVYFVRIYDNSGIAATQKLIVR